ncbi:MAG: hypothetical protein ACYS76_01060 [Planctomycetota bacterium]|jgi:urease beta subunit
MSFEAATRTRMSFEAGTRIGMRFEAGTRIGMRFEAGTSRHLTLIMGGILKRSLGMVSKKSMARTALCEERDEVLGYVNDTT